MDLLATMLLQAQRSGRGLKPAEKELATAMIEQSDNDATTRLWNRTGGIEAGTDVFGLTATTPGPDGGWGGMGRITGSDTDATVVVLSRGHETMEAGVDLVERAARTARTYLGW
ncbi:hypothetical protein HC030_28740 [Planosporangium mesophilum]|uniref:hypothetical protein n=1 Tax=Planosporangium mesophilum TaxID=689768 RepID=UPI00143B6E8B|nr:hypothetical protein [Planosporangium mesophilum]NJC86495.1 hypothetical protein [Planosporangium mesophilum]